MWIWVGKHAFSQLSVEPHRAQNPRFTPGDESNFAIAPLVKVMAECSNDTNTDAGAPLCFLQLSQWHQSTHFGLPLAANHKLITHAFDSEKALRKS